MNKFIKDQIIHLKPSTTLAINEESNRLKKSGKKIYKFGFGQSPFPIPESIVNKLKINACTDVTGYGLLGHLNEMCSNTNLTASINFNNISFMNKVSDFASKHIIPGGTKNNLKFYQSNIHFDKGINKYQKLMLTDAQTSGGLLISVNKNDSNILIDYLNNNSYYKTQIIGFFSTKKNINIIVNNE